jgi:hypothetical protein
MRPLTIVAVASAALLGCSESLGPSRVLTTPALIASAPAEALIDGVAVRVAAYVWRDMSPGNTGSGLTVGASARASGAGSLPVGMSIERLWVVQHELAWSAVARQENPPAHAGELPVMSRNGPTWFGRVDVVLQLRDAQGLTRYIGARDLVIQVAM